MSPREPDIAANNPPEPEGDPDRDADLRAGIAAEEAAQEEGQAYDPRGEV